MVPVRAIVGIVVGSLLIPECIGMSGIQIDDEFGRIPFRPRFINYGLIQALELGDGCLRYSVPEPRKRRLRCNPVLIKHQTENRIFLQ